MTAETVTDWTVTEPGLFFDMPEDVYHADPVPHGSLSVSGAKKLLPPCAPAIYDYERRNGSERKDVFDFGRAAHAIVTGTGAELHIVDADDWRGKAAREEKDAAHAAGKTPLLRSQYEQVVAMADALHDHPLASMLLADGVAEVSAFWQDDDTGIWRRARYDWLPDAADGRIVVPDYKTAASANPDKFGRAIFDYGYYMQAAWYLDGLRALDISDDAEFVFVAQEKTPPYLVSVFDLDDEALAIGRLRNAEALAVYAECDRTGVWPGYADEIITVSLPAWYANQLRGEL